jgi:hypothetical protein
MLNIPETWLEPEKLISILEDHRCNSFTVTNHNNARSATIFRIKDMIY